MADVAEKAQKMLFLWELSSVRWKVVGMCVQFC